jgi:hypothetical protein
LAGLPSIDRAALLLAYIGTFFITGRSGRLIEYKMKNPQKDINTPLRVSHDHLLITPPSHFTPRKVED